MRRTDMSSRGALGRSGPSHQLSQPAGHRRTNPGRSHPEAYRQQSTSRGGFRCVLWSTRWHALEGENRKDPRDSRPSRRRVVRHQPERSPRGWRKVRPESEKTKRGWGKAGSEIVGRVPVAVLAFRTLAFFAFDRLLDDALLDDRRGRVGRSGRRHRPAGLESSRRRASDSRATARWALIAHQGSALVADRGRHGVEGPAGRARLRAHLAHLLFLAEPVFEGEEGRLLAPPFLELGLAQAAAQLSGGFLLEAGDDLIVLEAHLLLVVRHLQLTCRELDAALRALFHVDRDPGLAVRALRHVPLELDAALRARRRVLRDEGAALAALDHLAEAVDLPVQRHADRDGRRGRQDDQEEPPLDAEDRDLLEQEGRGSLHRDRAGVRLDQGGRRRHDDRVRPVLGGLGHGDRAEEESVTIRHRGVRREDRGAAAQLDVQDHAADAVGARVPNISRDAQRVAGDDGLAAGGGQNRGEPGRRRLDGQGDVGEVVALLRGSALVDRVVRVDDELERVRPERADSGHVQRLVQGRDDRQAVHAGDLARAVSVKVGADRDRRRGGLPLVRNQGVCREGLVLQDQPFTAYALISNQGQTTATAVSVGAYLDGNRASEVARVNGLTVVASLNQTLNVAGIGALGAHTLELI